MDHPPLQAGADPNQKMNKDGALPSMSALAFGTDEGLESATIHLKHGADPHVPEKNDAFKIAEKITNKSLSKRALRILEKATSAKSRQSTLRGKIPNQ